MADNVGAGVVIVAAVENFGDATTFKFVCTKLGEEGDDAPFSILRKSAFGEIEGEAVVTLV